MKTSTKARKRNPRGEGVRLGEEIVEAATRLIDAAGVEAVTLRAVAREAGISAPSIYPHFDDRDQILGAVIQHCFAALTQAISAARDAERDPVARLCAGCSAYLGFAERHPNRYSLLFRQSPAPHQIPFADRADNGAIAFATLVDGIAECVAAGLSTSTEPFADAVALWSGLHGYATLHTGQSTFPWPEPQATLNRIIHGLARISPG